MGEYQTADFFEHYGGIPKGYEIFDSWETQPEDHKHFAFAEVTSTLEADILNLIGKDKRITPEVVSTVLKIDRATIARKMAEMVSKGLIEQSIGPDNEVERKAAAKPPSDIKPTTTDIILRYSYEKRAIAEGDDILPTTRPFCKKLVELQRTGRMYSRMDIEAITQRVGYNVFERSGGWWFHNGKADPQCRHYWKTNILMRKR
jgi:hypothetical protein